jgi:hypothetical protein
VGKFKLAGLMLGYRAVKISVAVVNITGHTLKLFSA